MEAYMLWREANSHKIQNTFNIAGVKTFALFPSKEFILAAGVTIIYQGATGAVAVPKGLAIRTAMAAVLDDIDGENGNGVVERKNSYIVLIDGSGAFHFDCIFQVLQKLVDTDKSVVLGRRPGSEWFMEHIDRKKVEIFENHLLTRWHEIHRNSALDPPLYDAQAGCCGMTASALTTLPLTARGYEIQFDLVSSAVMTGAAIDFTDELAEGGRIGGSTFRSMSSATTPINYANSLTKMRFISHKLGFNTQEINRLLDAYIADTQDSPELFLPKEYIQLIRQNSFEADDERQPP